MKVQEVHWRVVRSLEEKRVVGKEEREEVFEVVFSLGGVILGGEVTGEEVVVVVEEAEEGSEDDDDDEDDFAGVLSSPFLSEAFKASFCLTVSFVGSPPFSLTSSSSLFFIASSSIKSTKSPKNS